MFARAATLVLASFLGAAVGCGLSVHRVRNSSAGDYDFLKEHGPPPHHVPSRPGGISFRFAMVHDVLHERYPKHGSAHHRESERLARAELASVRKDVPAAFLATDGLAIALARQGRRTEALRLLHENLVEQERAKVDERGRYATYANIGSISMVEYESRYLAGDPMAGELATDGAGFTQRALNNNPNAHFNRLGWHLILHQMMFQAHLRNRDFLGNSLEDSLRTIFGPNYPAAPPAWQHNPEDPVQRFLHDSEPFDDPRSWDDYNHFRKHIARLRKNTDGTGGIPFDEPMLAVVGLWRESDLGRADLALAIGETMIRVGQRRIAWCAYERAAAFGSRYSPRPEVRAKFVEHCRKRQGELAESLSLDAGAEAEMRSRFEAELRYGEEHQRAYQEYEAERIANGASIRDPEFYRDFHAVHESIATASGAEERTSRTSQPIIGHYQIGQVYAWTMAGAGMGAMLFAVVVRLRVRRRSIMPRAAS